MQAVKGVPNTEQLILNYFNMDPNGRIVLSNVIHLRSSSERYSNEIASYILFMMTMVLIKYHYLERKPNNNTTLHPSGIVSDHHLIKGGLRIALTVYYPNDVESIHKDQRELCMLMRAIGNEHKRRLEHGKTEVYHLLIASLTSVLVRRQNYRKTLRSRR